MIVPNMYPCSAHLPRDLIIGVGCGAAIALKVTLEMNVIFTNADLATKLGHIFTNADLATKHGRSRRQEGPATPPQYENRADRACSCFGSHDSGSGRTFQFKIPLCRAARIMAAR